MRPQMKSPIVNYSNQEVCKGWAQQTPLQGGQGEPVRGRTHLFRAASWGWGRGTGATQEHQEPCSGRRVFTSLTCAWRGVAWMNQSPAGAFGANPEMLVETRLVWEG